MFKSLHGLRSVRFRSGLIVRLACILAAGFLFAPRVQAQTLIIGTPSMNYNVQAIFFPINAHSYFVPFAFDFGGGQYSLDSIQLLMRGNGPASDLGLSIMSTPDTASAPLLALSGTIPFSGTEEAYTFVADAPALLASGETYYLFMENNAPGSQLDWLPIGGAGGELPGGGPGDGGPPPAPAAGSPLPRLQRSTANTRSSTPILSVLRPAPWASALPQPPCRSRRHSG